MDKIKTILLNHRGKKNAISSKKLAYLLNIEEDDTHYGTRTMIKNCMEKYRLPVIANRKGYYIPKNKTEINEYIANLDRRIAGIEQRKQAILDNFNVWSD